MEMIVAAILAGWVLWVSTKIVEDYQRRQFAKRVVKAVREAVEAAERRRQMVENEDEENERI